MGLHGQKIPEISLPSMKGREEEFSWGLWGWKMGIFFLSPCSVRLEIQRIKFQ